MRQAETPSRYHIGVHYVSRLLINLLYPGKIFLLSYLPCRFVRHISTFSLGLRTPSCHSRDIKNNNDLVSRTLCNGDHPAVRTANRRFRRPTTEDVGPRLGQRA